MPTISDYKKHYPNLTQSQIKLMHAARVASQYNTWSLSHVRTVALTPLVYQVDPSAEQLNIADALFHGATAKFCTKDELHYPRLDSRDAGLLVQTLPPKVPLEGIELHASDWVMCRQVGYHSDTVDCDNEAYAFWCVKSTHPMTLMLGGNAYPMKDGQLVIFDARVPHALLCANEDASMVGMISTAPLTPLLREHLGIAWRRANNVSLDKLKIMDDLVVDMATGAFSSPTM